MEEAISVVNLWLQTLVLSHGVVEVARAYLRMTPAEAEPETLRTLLTARVESDGSQLAQVIRADFARPDTVAINGWIVSRTEARLAALRFLAG
jgi:hypothetical protein